MRLRLFSRSIPVRGLLGGLALAGLLAPGTLAGTGEDIESRVIQARNRVFPALVHVEPILEVFRGGERGRVAVNGSGVIITEDGLVLTNAHVVERAERVTCVLSDRREIPAEVMGRDEATDLAVLRLDAEALAVSPVPVAELGSSSDLEVGQWVMAMGSPLGLARSVSLGVVSSVDRYLPVGQLPGGAWTGAFNTWIQTDAAINPGNSGGPLVDLSGRIVGINARAVTVVGENVGFAIPADVVHQVLPLLVAEGKVPRSDVGLLLQSMRALPESQRREVPAGVVVGGVEDGSSAEEAGVLTGDLLLSWDGEPVVARFDDSLPEIRRRMATTPTGSPVAAAFWREGTRLLVHLIPRDLEEGGGDQFEAREWGFTVRAVTPQFARDHNLMEETGVMVTGIKEGSYAARSGLGQGEVVLRLDEQEVGGLDTFASIYDAAVEREAPMVLVETRAGAVLGWRVLRPVYQPRDAGEEVEDEE